MALDPRIILAGQAPNVFDGFMQGQAAGRQNALADLYKNQGGAIMAGDPNALNALAQFDPQAAMGVQQQQFGFEQAKLEAMRAAEAHAAKMSAAEADATAKQLERGIAAGLAAQTPEQWDQLVTQFGAPDLVGQFGNKEAIANTFMGVAEVMKRRAEAATPADEYGRYVAEETAAGRTPLDRIGFEQAKKGKGITYTGADGTTIQIGGGVQQNPPVGQDPMNTGTPRDGGKFSVKLSENDAAALAASQQAAAGASQLESIATQLETLTPSLGYTGPGGKIYGAADDFVGILPGDEGSRGAFRSLSTEAQLSFTEKTKGAITDREMAVFASAVPSLSQRPEANAMIAQVMRAGAARVQSKHNFMEAWARKYGSLEGSEAVWQEFMRENPIIEGGQGGVQVRPDGDWQGYLNRKPVMAYTPQAIMGLSIEELSQVPIEQMTPQQLDAIERRFNELGQ